jgi:rare lipoprotein A
MRNTFFTLASILSLALCWAVSSSFFAEEFGKAGYYADSLHGRKTSSGEKYDKNLLTCAHKSLPFGTKIRVTRLDNKHSVIVKVNDRGPFAEGYVVDVSRKAAEELGLIRAGSARVKIEVVEKPAPAASKAPSASAAKTASSAATQLVRPAQYSTATKQPATLTAKGAAATNDPTPAEPVKAAPPRKSELFKVDISNLEKKGYGIQVNTLNDADNVLPVIRKLRKDWPGKVMVTVERDEATDVNTYRVILGPYTERNAADAQQKLAERRGYKKCFVVDLAEV